MSPRRFASILRSKSKQRGRVPDRSESANASLADERRRRLPAVPPTVGLRSCHGAPADVSGVTAVSRGERGAALFLALVLFLMLTAVALATLFLADNHFVLTNEMVVRTRSYYLTEAGLQQAFWALRRGYWGTGSFSFTEAGATIDVVISAPDASGERTVNTSVTYQTIENL